MTAGKPRACVVEIVEKGRTTSDSMGGSVIMPNDVRINGVSILCPPDPVIVHEITTDEHEATQVTLTLYARLVVIAAEDDIEMEAAK